MAKVTMYKGVDLRDGTLSIFAVSDEGTAAKLFRGEIDMWATPEKFKSVPYVWYDSHEEHAASVMNAELIWEADL